MRIDRIQIDGFGRAEETTLLLTPGLTLIRGANGSGKTTIHQFLHAILFGLVKDRYPLVRGGRRGGTLAGVTDDGRSFELTRHGDPITGAAQRLAVRINGIDLADRESAIASITGGVTKYVFESIFAFGQDELRDLSRLTSDEVADRIYGASIGVVAAILKVEAGIEGERDALWKARGSVPEVNLRLARIEHLEQQLRARNLPTEYGQLRRKLEELEHNLADRNIELAKLKDQRDHVALVRAARIPWQRAAEMRRAFAGLPDELRVSSDDLTREAAFAKAAALAVAAAAKMRARREALDTSLSSAAYRADVIDRGAEIDAAVTEAGNWRSRQGDLDERRRRGVALRQTIEGAAADADWDEKRLRAADFVALRRQLAEHAIADLDTPTRAVAAPMATAKSAASEAVRVGERLAELERDLAAISGVDLARADRLDGDARAIERDLSMAGSLRVLIAANPPPRPVPPQRGLTMALAGASGIGAVAGVLLTAFLNPVLGLLFVAAGLGGIALAMVLVLRTQVAAPLAVEGVNSKELHALELHLATRWSELELPGSPSVERLEPVRAEATQIRTQAEARRRVIADRDSIAKDLARRQDLAATALEAEKQAHADVVKGIERWADFLRSAALRTGLDRDGAMVVIQKLETAQNALNELGELTRGDTKTERERTTWTAGVVRLASELNIGPDDDVDVLAELLRQELANAKGAYRIREQLVRQREAAGIAEREADDTASDSKREHADLLLSFGVADGAALAARHGRTQERDRFGAAREQAEAAFNELVPEPERGTVVNALETVEPAALDDQHRALSEAIAQLDGTRDSLIAAIGEASEQLRQLAANADTSEVRQRLADERGGVAADARQWLILRVASELLQATRSHYEAKHRPAVLARAEQLFVAWIGGEYSGFDHLSESGLDAVIRADDGKRVPLAGLSRGTAEQLYLAMRIALVEHLATQQESLPLVMDDVLVNFDPERAPRVARSIEEISRTRQVIYLTCHKEVEVAADRIINVGSNVEVLSMIDASHAIAVP